MNICKLSPKISIFIPIYNVEKFLRQCLESLIAQTFTDWECWLIDDGSRDSSGDICDEFALKDSRIHVIHKENGGTSSARQCGMDHCTAEYVLTMDSDDWVEPDYLSSMLETAESTMADVVMCAFYYNTDKEQVYVPNSPSSTLPFAVQNEAFGRKTIHCGLWSKLFRRSLFVEHQIKWPKYYTFEDMFIFISVLQFAKKIVYQPHATYHYRHNTQSITNNADFRKRYRWYIDFVEMMVELNGLYHFDSRVETCVIFDNSINNTKKYLIESNYEKKHEILPLLKYFPHSMKLKYCRCKGDFIYLFASRYGFFFPYRLRALCSKIKNRNNG